MTKKKIMLALCEKSNQELYEAACLFYEEIEIGRRILAAMMTSNDNCNTIVRDYLMKKLLEVDAKELKANGII